jgi:hypothetical protein
MAFIINAERVGDDTIEEEFDAIKEHYTNLGEVVCCDRDEEFMGYARDNVVNRVLLTQESGKRFGETSDAEIDAMVNQLKEEHGGEEKFYSNTGFTPADDSRIRRKVSATISVDKLLEEEIGPDPEVAEEDLKNYYEENIDQFMTEEEVQVSQIFKEPKSHEEAKDTYQYLRKARERILDGEDFDAVAEEASDKKGDEINLGFFKQGETMPEIEALTFSMRDGEISPIVATHFGFHIFKLTGRKQSEPVPFEEIKDQLTEPYLNRRREALMKELVEGLKSAATIEDVAAEEEEVVSNP